MSSLMGGNSWGREGGQRSRGNRKRGMGRQCLMDGEFLFGVVKKVLAMNQGDGCTTL